MRDPHGHPAEAEKVFTFRLARDLGMTVAELERRLTTREFAEWAAFYAAEGKEIEAARKKAEKKAKTRR